MTCMLKMEQTHVRDGKKRYERWRGHIRAKEDRDSRDEDTDGHDIVEMKI